MRQYFNAMDLVSLAGMVGVAYALLTLGPLP